MRNRTTKSHIDFWSKRKIDWVKDYAATATHPHRFLIIEELKKMHFNSIMEVGCASGPNLLLIEKIFPNIQIGGCDVSEDAIKTAQQLMPRGIFDVRPAQDLYFSDKSVDVGLADAVFIYLSPKNALKAAKEMKRVAKKNVIFFEFHEKRWWKRLAIWFSSGYFAHDWEKLLKKAGYFDIEIKKMPAKAWPGMPWEYFGHVITAKI